MKTTAVAKVVIKATQAILLGSLVGLAGCTKKRTERLAPGMGDNLKAVSAFNNKVYPLETLNPVGKLETLNVTRAKDVNFKAPEFGIDQFAIVDYRTDAKLLGATKIVARPRKSNAYEIHYRMTDDYLKIFKVAKEVDIPLHERTYGEKEADGRMAIPLLGYKIQGKFVLERIENEIGQKTSLLRERSVLTLAEATHVRLDLASPEIFQAVQKPDLIPLSYFEGEWFFAETIVQAPERASENIGAQIEGGVGSSTRIKFMKFKDTLEAVSLNVDERIKGKGDLDFSRMFILPIERKSYRATPVGKSTGMKEEENNEIAWDKRELALINFEKVVSNFQADSIPGRTLDGAKLVNLEIQSDYLSFTLQPNDVNVRLKLSLKRVQKTNYAEKVHFRDDWQKFGYFTTEKARVRNFELHRKEDFEKNIFISRFNPKAKNVEFRFSRTTPDWVRPTVKKAILAWDDTFCRAFNGNDAQICDQINKCKIDALGRDKNNETCDSMAQQAHYPQVTLNEKDGDADLGDLRYNIVNMIETESESNLFGFGPSLTDPYTGEIISATSNVHVTPIRAALVDELRNYKLMKLGYLSELKLAGVNLLRGDKGISVDTKTSSISVDLFELASLKEMKIPKGLLRFLPQGLANQLNTPEKYVKLNFLKGNAPHGREFDLALTSKNIHREIETKCTEYVKYVNALKSQKEAYNEKELDLLNSCSRELVLDKMMGTLVHELGHNFGLRHNFMGSNDSANFWPAEKTGGEVVRSSSTMEYTAFNEDRLTKPGLYDIAAIRYGYADKVTLTSGKTTALDIRKTIDQNLNGQMSKNYKFCTDEHTDLYGLDPMCRRHDTGTTPTEVVQHMIQDYRTSYSTINVRYDRAWSSNPLRVSLFRLRNLLIPMKHFNERWRIMMAEFLGRDKMYLEGMSEEQYNQVANALMKDAKLGAEATELKKASDMAFDFLMSIVSLPNQYCLVTDAVGTYNLIELEKVRQESFSAGVNNVTSCTNASVQFWFASKGLTPVLQLGYPIENVRYDMRPESMTQRYDSNIFLGDYDITGTVFDRLFATQVLSMRQSLSMRSAQLGGFTPNFLDIPEYRRRYVEATMSRLGQGVSVDELASALSFSLEPADIEKLKKQKPFFSKFEFEKDLVEFRLEEMIVGLLIPGKQSENIERLADFQVVTYSNQTDIKQVQEDDSKIVIPIGQTILVVSKSQEKLAKLAQSLRSANQMRNFKGFSAEVIQHFRGALKALKLPSNAAAAEKMTALEYFAGFKAFANLVLSAPETLSTEMRILLSSHPEIAAVVNVVSEISKLEQQAAVDSISTLKEMFRAQIKQQSPQATDEQVNSAIEEHLEKMIQSGLSNNNLKQASDQAKQQLAQVKQQFGQSATKMIGERLITQDRLDAYLKARQLQIDLKVKDAQLNHKDYEAQSDLILGFLIRLTRFL